MGEVWVCMRSKNSDAGGPAGTFAQAEPYAPSIGRGMIQVKQCRALAGPVRRTMDDCRACSPGPPMNKNLWLLALCQGLFLTNNVVFIAINGLVGLQLAPYGWMATLPVMGYVVGGALATGLVART